MAGLLSPDAVAGLQWALSADALTYCTLGVCLGMIVGVIPGVGVLASVALLMPLTFHLDHITAIAMLAGIYYGSAYGGSTASILLNLPGTESTAITALDGYPMAKKGKAGVALFVTTIASFVGSVIGIVLLAGFAFPIAALALKFGSQEYFALMVLGLVAASMVSAATRMKSLVTIVLGVSIGLIGIDINSGVARHTFGIPSLYDGVSIVAVALGIFGLTELIRSAGQREEKEITEKISFRNMLPTRMEMRQSWPAILRGSGIGSFFGALPGTGGAIASFVSYAVERRINRKPEKFGYGAIEGISGPEAANNAAVQTSFIPTLTLGIPGNPVMALILGVLMVHGIAPGPQFLETNTEMFWGLVASFVIGNLILLILNIPLIGIWTRILTIPYSILYPSIIGFLCIGVYSVSYAPAELYLLAGLGLVGHFMMVLGFPIPPLLIGIVLGPMIEENFRRSMLLQGGDVMGFFGKPFSAAILLLCIAIVVALPLADLRARRRDRKARANAKS
ncbi:tripartite tricarboxylate transporter permease [Roseicyclus sp. F158]|uniref:Tripartite tricarboxylate transporter permease n=1 Tax=Tropicimonas omnivorans TaxID=3075590 RepID=A0ABU3DE57_9RHOB|nr:tripartite tricarboxylate transporter permease [Roseicyclus sp. F158]MDT0682013.1 tripartite tricarboxylate transporter permease [Roseicyclus sp. F158]